MIGQLTVFTAGLWGIWWPALTAIAIIACLLLIAYISPIGKRFFIEAAIVVAIGLGVYQYGIHQADARCRAQNIAATKVINKVVHKAVAKTRTKKARAAVDPWNRKDY
jgi:hypothetical protein